MADATTGDPDRTAAPPSSSPSSSSGGSARQSMTIAAPLAAVLDTIADFPRYPEWVPAVRSSEVVSRDDDGRPVEVDFVLVAGVVEDEYRLRYTWSADDGDRPSGEREHAEVHWELAAPSVLQKRQEGSYVLERATPDRGGDAEAGNGDGPPSEATTVTYAVDIELTVDMLGRFRDRARRRIVTAALEDLAARVEGRAGDR